ncbi:MAG: hypothetical protein ACRERS_05865, partial [Methylococcales bacterium]
ARTAFEGYRKAYPQGRYAASATGLLRRIAWLDGNLRQLAETYAWQLLEATPTQRNQSIDELVQEVDNKLLPGATPDDIQNPVLLAVVDLMRMRGREASEVQIFSLAELRAQQAVFTRHPELFAYVQSVFHFFGEKNPDFALALLPALAADKPLDYLAFSQQTLRALALEAKQDWNGAEHLWLQLLSVAEQPYQQPQLQLALALNYERSKRLDRVFAARSPVQTPQLRHILIRHVANADLLRQRVRQAGQADERDTALFVLLYKDLTRGRYADFGNDLQWFADRPSEKLLTTSIGYRWGFGHSLALFRWKGDKAESGYVCPTISASATALRDNPKDPEGLICLGEFILRNDLDGMPLDSRPDAHQLGASPSAFEGEVFSRLDGYREVIANADASQNDKAYARYRAVNCFAPSGNNRCGAQDIDLDERKNWFHELKTRYADTSWAKQLKYYW